MDEAYKLKRALIHQETEWREKYQALLNEKAQLSLKAQKFERKSDDLERQLACLKERLESKKNHIFIRDEKIKDLKTRLSSYEEQSE